MVPLKFYVLYMPSEDNGFSCPWLEWSQVQLIEELWRKCGVWRPFVFVTLGSKLCCAWSVVHVGIGNNFVMVWPFYPCSGVQGPHPSCGVLLQQETV